ncbi:MAG: PHP domain-containing protein, partial [Phycisphaerae bacterium]|nr:PHP domain-containing protein [Phycisphaerae bacterium]
MPDTPDIKLRQPPPPPKTVTPCEIPYAELDVTSNFSFLRGASHPDELVYTAASLGYRAIALTDVCTLAGMVRAHSAAKQCGMKLLVGCRLKFVDGTPDVLVWCTNRMGYGNLCRLLTIGKRRTEKGKCQLHLEDLIERNQGLIAGIDLQATGHLSGLDEPAQALQEKIRQLALSFPPSPGGSSASSLYLTVYRHYGHDDDSHLDRMIILSRRLGI